MIKPLFAQGLFLCTINAPRISLLYLRNLMTNRMKRLYTLFCVILFIITASAQNLIKCDDGSSYWILKDKGKMFALHLRGDIAQANIPQLLNIEETGLHYNILNKSEYLKKGGGGSDAAVLTRFIQGEEKFLCEKMKPEYELKKLPSGKNCLLWHHDWFGADEATEQQVHITIILNDAIVWLSAPKFVGQDRTKIESFLLETIATLRSIKDTKGLCGK